MWSRNCLPFRSTCVHPHTGVPVVRYSVLCAVLCRSLYVHLSFLLWPLYCLSFFDLRLRVYPSCIFKLSLVYCVDHYYFFWPLYCLFYLQLFLVMCYYFVFNEDIWMKPFVCLCLTYVL